MSSKENKRCFDCGAEVRCGYQQDHRFPGGGHMAWLAQCGNDSCVSPITFSRHSQERALEAWNRYMSDLETDTAAAIAKQAAAPSASISDGEVEGWQPIETAPEGDGLLWLFEPHSMGGFMFAGCRNKNGEWINNLDAQVQAPTYWRPLPAEPAMHAATAQQEES